MTAVVVLAAGLGSRLGAGTHKSLVPVRDGVGTLPLLLGALAGQPWVSGVSVVTGWRAEEVAAAIRAVLPSARVVHNPDYRRTGPLQSLACAVAERDPAADPAVDAWALTADTYFTPAFMAAVADFEGARSAEDCGAVCVKALTRAEDPAAATAVAVRDGWVQGLDPHESTGELILAQAFRWPAAAISAVRAGGAMGATSQWQLVDALVNGRIPGKHIRFRALQVPPDSCFDIDTADDLRTLRERLR